jgi:hypothetical protein
MVVMKKLPVVAVLWGMDLGKSIAVCEVKVGRARVYACRLAVLPFLSH